MNIGRLASPFVALALVLACTRAQDAARVRHEPAPPPAPPSASILGDTVAAPTTSPLHTPPLTDPPPDPARASGWTDDAVVTALAADCRWQPPKGESPEDSANPRPLSCDLEFEQSCVPDPCFDADQSECKPKCKSGCDTCAAACASSCDSCKEPCKDDACRRACAQASGTCHQQCLSTKDQCTTGTCGQAYEACRARLLVEFSKGPCKAACARAASCGSSCMEKGPTPECFDRCKKNMGACPAKYFGMCMMGGGPGN